MNQVCWPYFDPDFDNLPERIHGPTCRVCIDNESMETCTVVKVDSVNKQGLLLEVVQILTDLNLTISKSYISSDAGWFMDVFHLKDVHGNKLTDQNIINAIQQAIGTARGNPDSAKAKSTYSNKIFRPDQYQNEHTAVEMTGKDRPGLFSEISAALADLHCNIVEAHAWSHNDRLACVAYISDHESSGTPIDDPDRLATIEDHLSTVLRATTIPSLIGSIQTNQQEVKAGFLEGSEEGTNMTNVERRLHQLMLSVRDFEVPSALSSLPTMTTTGSEDSDDEGRKTVVKIERCDQKRYSIVNIECKDRARLMFDTVCTLTDMQYMIFHASISSDRGYAFQEYFIRHLDGCALDTESEKERVIKCLEAAIERRVCEGVRLELCADNRVGLLSDITRVLRENGLTVVRADVATQGEKAVNALYVRDISGNEVDMETFAESMKKEIMGPIALQVKNETKGSPSNWPERSRLSLGDMLKSHIERLSHNFIPIK
ncbi:ACT domain-containing protein ACR2 [Juglans microcarpa x Juglans regia]|uniref:ACT domain-containing protein ACR2 n=1 Tax=Juglans microcarpa x Juglans regia TaxID=2249226 RepID=UPI001B7DDC9E|nr:ACT domain-containing protein ACR2 [Juglans microcarpa x Juglans regia]